MTATASTRVRVGDLLVQNKLLTEGQLELAIAEQRHSGRKLGQIAVSLGFVAEERLLRIISRQLDIPYIDLNQYKVDKEVVSLLPEAHARRLRAIAIGRRGTNLIVAMEDPTDILFTDELKRILGQPIEAALVKERDLDRFFDVAYRQSGKISSIATELHTQMGETSGFDIDLNTDLDAEDSEAPVVRLLQSIFEDAVRVNASDIHIEPGESVLRIRHRVDGILQEYIVKEKGITAALMMRLKIIAGMNISEKRLPQDGRFSITVKGRDIDVRISTLPIQWGESIVMRLLDHANGMLPLEALGMPADIQERYEKLIRNPHGMILVTGPTGSGKTTTLYATLNKLNSEGTKIITAEDPVEYRLPRVNQVQINPKIDLSFARVLRAALRQDPDIVLVGEMRDSETAQIGLRAAMTGHMVFSTLHTNDALSTAIRLVDMGVEPFLVSSALLGMLAQRLVRKVCEGCSQPYTPDSQELICVRTQLGESCDPDVEYSFKHGVGCNSCNHTGYKGRIGVYELLMMDGKMIEAFLAKEHEAFNRAARAQAGYRPLAQTAMNYAVQGLTTITEAAKVAHGIE